MFYNDFGNINRYSQGAYPKRGSGCPLTEELRPSDYIETRKGINVRRG